MANFELRNDKVYKKGSGKQLGYVRGDKIYLGSSGNQLGYVRGDKIYLGSSGKQLGYVRGDKIYLGSGGSTTRTTVKDIIKDFKDSDILKDVMIVAAYHFLCKNIF